MKFENTDVLNFKGAIRGMRNPKNSWYKSDSMVVGNQIKLGPNDLKLAQQLVKGGTEHRKFLRQIFVSVDITAPMYWFQEFDTYKIGTVRNSCSFMHKGTSKPFELKDFAIDDGTPKDVWKTLLEALNKLRDKYLETKDDKYFRQIRQLLPQSYLYRSTITMNYENIYTMCSQRRNHRLREWSEDFIKWAKSLPHAQELIFFDEVVTDEA